MTTFSRSISDVLELITSVKQIYITFREHSTKKFQCFSEKLGRLDLFFDNFHRALSRVGNDDIDDRTPAIRKTLQILQQNLRETEPILGRHSQSCPAERRLHTKRVDSCTAHFHRYSAAWLASRPLNRRPARLSPHGLSVVCLRHYLHSLLKSWT